MLTSEVVMDVRQKRQEFRDHDGRQGRDALPLLPTLDWPLPQPMPSTALWTGATNSERCRPQILDHQLPHLLQLYQSAVCRVLL